MAVHKPLPRARFKVVRKCSFLGNLGCCFIAGFIRFTIRFLQDDKKDPLKWVGKDPCHFLSRMRGEREFIPCSSVIKRPVVPVPKHIFLPLYGGFD